MCARDSRVVEPIMKSWRHLKLLISERIGKSTMHLLEAFEVIGRDPRK